MNWRFYRFETAGERRPLPDLGENCRANYWRPGWRAWIPPGTAMFPFGVWWLFHQFGVFANPDYGVFTISIGENAEKLIHRSCVFPGYFRFPFMGRDDLQIGDTWTDPAFRGHGLATLAIRHVLALHSERKRIVWYVVENTNTSSIRAVEKAGFVLAGRGRRTARFHMRVFGQFLMESVEFPSDKPTPAYEHLRIEQQ